MNLKKLFEAQKELDEVFLNNHPIQEGENRTEKTILALLVEVGECANEWRGFKYWSNDQEARKIHLTTQGATLENAVKFKCADEYCGEDFEPDDIRFIDLLGENKEVCPECEEGSLYAMRLKNPVLEEYVDGLHFILNLGNEIEYIEAPFMINTDPYIHTEDEDVNAQFIEVYHDIAYYWNNFKNEEDRFTDYEDILCSYLGLGQVLGFTAEEIEVAYFQKNKINHDRQKEGY